ncbi:ATP-binding protein [Streptomyces luteolifulvus]|uniref:ATP-binding protein n=2 Tax=Streptomyces luteolifulvus TaxID=2615112 RepID=A0A6H9UX99_9ACTN|nr:ATP-binding protein [Streptomyces luteolifulvus]
MTPLGPSPTAPWTDAVLPGQRGPAPPCSARAQFTLPAQEALVGRLRAVAADQFTCWRLSGDERDSAVLIVGELAANAARHGCSEMTLCLLLDPGMLRIVVSDHGDPAPGPARSADGDPDEHGRGLDIVRALSIRVDLRHHDGGTWVLAHISIDSQSCSRIVC